MILGIERSLSRLEQQQRNTYALSPHASTRALPLKMADGDYVIGDDVKRTLSIDVRLTSSPITQSPSAAPCILRGRSRSLASSRGGGGGGGGGRESGNTRIVKLCSGFLNYSGETTGRVWRWCIRVALLAAPTAKEGTKNVHFTEYIDSQWLQTKELSVK